MPERQLPVGQIALFFLAIIGTIKIHLSSDTNDQNDTREMRTSKRMCNIPLKQSMQNGSPERH